MSPALHGWFDRAWRGLLLGLMTLFVVNIGLMIAAVATSSFAKRWLGTWLPEGWTTTWYTAAWKEFQLDSVLWVTVEVVFAVVFLALLIGVPAAYTLARRNFPGKRLLMLLFLLPLMVPPITYGIPLATVLYKLQLAGTIYGVIIANLIPRRRSYLAMTPLIDRSIRTSSRRRASSAPVPDACSGTPRAVAGPGIIAASLLCWADIELFERTSYRGPRSQKLVVAWTRVSPPRREPRRGARRGYWADSGG